MGNLDGFAQLVERLAQAARSAGSPPCSAWPGWSSLVAGIPAVALGGQPLAPFDFWRSSRVIPNDTINEFPFWTFLFADLHPHLMSIPYQVVTLGVLLNLAHGGGATCRRCWPRLRRRPEAGAPHACAGCGA